MEFRRLLSIVMLIAVGLAGRARAEGASSSQSKGLFDPARHMRVSEVRVGMKGYGVSVFRGTKLEKFDVEVLAILKNFNPKYDVILITCHGANLEHTGSVAGMSGSPIYLKDDQGRYRMIGAFAYGWPMTKDPLAGVQPIEYMLELGTEPRVGGSVGSQVAQPMTTWSYHEMEKLVAGMSAKPQAAGERSVGSNEIALKPLATPMMVSGMAPSVASAMEGMFRNNGLIPLQSGGASTAATQPVAKLEPGAALAVPLLTGDVDFTAIGTVTEVIGNRVYGFGHPFNNEGPIDLPMGVGEIATVVPNLQTSFKLGTMTQLIGTLSTDQIVGIAGKVGKTPATIPIDLTIHYADGSGDKSYHFDAVKHQKLTPMLTVAAINSAVAGARELPPHHTLNYDITMEFGNGATLHAQNTSVDQGPIGLLSEIAMPVMAGAENPFQKVWVKKISGTVTVTPEARQAKILAVNVPKLKLRPGDMVKAYVTYRPFRGSETTMPIMFELPRDLPEGNYDLTVSDWQKYLHDEEDAKPFRFSAEKIGDVFAVLQEVENIKHDSIYVRIVRQADGVAVGRTSMARMPSSMRQVLLGSGRSNVTSYVSSNVTPIPAGFVMNGSADFQIKVDKDARVEPASKQVTADADESADSK